MIVAPGKRAVIPTGLAIALPAGFELQVRGRSGMAAKHGILPANGVGTIDSDYRGEIGVILLNTSQETFAVEPGMRIAQGVIARYEVATWQVVDELDETERASGGYGSTGSA
jgi:dUTP pyrophosphatase